MSNDESRLHQLFVSRTHHQEILIAAADSTRGSRMGGRPPKSVAELAPSCPICRNSVEYLLTLTGDVMGQVVACGKAVSVLFCRDIMCLMKSHRLLDPSSVVLLVHEDDERAEHASELDSPSEGRALRAGPLCEDPRDEEGEVRIDFKKLGGSPGWLQGWFDDEADKARERGGGFLFQWENFTPHDMKTGPDPFIGGVLYVFSRINPESKLPELADLTSFWQNT